MSEVLYRLEQSILNEPDSFSMYKDDLLGWIELLKEKQPQLNENQQIVLGQLKINAGSNGSLIKAIHSLFNLLTISSNQLEKDCTEGLLKSKNALARLTRKQAAEVLSAFAQWSLEQEEE